MFLNQLDGDCAEMSLEEGGWFLKTGTEGPEDCLVELSWFWRSAMVLVCVVKCVRFECDDSTYCRLR